MADGARDAQHGTDDDVLKRAISCHVFHVCFPHRDTLARRAISSVYFHIYFTSVIRERHANICPGSLYSPWIYGVLR